MSKTHKQRARIILAPRLSDRLIDQSVTRSNRSRMPMFEDSAFDCADTTRAGEGEVKAFCIRWKLIKPYFSEWPWAHFGDFLREKNSQKNAVSSRQRKSFRSKLGSYLQGLFTHPICAAVRYLDRVPPRQKTRRHIFLLESSACVYLSKCTIAEVCVDRFVENEHGSIW